MIIGLYLITVIVIIYFILKNDYYSRNEDNKSVNADSLIKLVKVFSILDEGIIISMLKSADIFSKSDSTHFQRVQFGNLTSCLYGINIYVYKDDINEAKTIVLDFISNKRNSFLNRKDSTRKTLSTLFFEPALHKEIPELLI